jgi:hypothetical protein
MVIYYWRAAHFSVLSNYTFISKGLLISLLQILTMKMETAMFAKKLENHKHSMWLIQER